MKTWNERLSSRRVMLGMKQIEFASAVGVTRSAVSLWESGKTGALALDNMERVCAVLHVHPAWLLRGEMPMEADQIPEKIAPAQAPDEEPQLESLVRTYSAAPDWLRTAMISVCRWLIAAERKKVEPLMQAFRAAVFDDTPMRNSAEENKIRDALWRAFEAADNDSRELVIVHLGIAPDMAAAAKKAAGNKVLDKKV